MKKNKKKTSTNPQRSLFSPLENVIHQVNNKKDKKGFLDSLEISLYREEEKGAAGREVDLGKRLSYSIKRLRSRQHQVPINLQGGGGKKKLFLFGRWNLSVWARGGNWPSRIIRHWHLIKLLHKLYELTRLDGLWGGC